MIKNTLKQLLLRLGFIIKKSTVDTNPSLQLIKTLNFLNIDLVLDIGANIGQFAEELRFFGYEGKIVSFEPLPQEHKILTKKANNDKNWTVFKRGAIGNEDGMIKINVSENSVSSSILGILDSHVSASKNSKYIDQVETCINKLDSIFPEIEKSGKNIFLKIDTQGYEWNVLKGSEMTLQNIKGLLIETSIEPLYKDQVLSEEIIQYLKNKGFQVWGFQNGFTNPENGRTLQLDLIFTKLSSN